MSKFVEGDIIELLDAVPWGLFLREEIRKGPVVRAKVIERMSHGGCEIMVINGTYAGTDQYGTLIEGKNCRKENSLYKKGCLRFESTTILHDPKPQIDPVPHQRAQADHAQGDF